MYPAFQDGNNRTVLAAVPLHGDQLLEERARNVQWTLRDGESQYDRLYIRCTLSIFKHISSLMNTISLSCTNNQIVQISGSQDFSSRVVSIWLINEKKIEKIKNSNYFFFYLLKLLMVIILGWSLGILADKVA